jgi:hypothetical protein
MRKDKRCADCLGHMTKWRIGRMKIIAGEFVPTENRRCRKCGKTEIRIIQVKGVRT